MSESTENLEATATEGAAASESAEPELLRAETAFIIMKAHDGSWKVTSDVLTPFAIDRVANRSDVRLGTSEISNLVTYQDIAAIVAAALKAGENS